MAYPLADTIRSGEPVRIGVVIRNGGAPRRFRNDPDLYRITALNAASDTVATSLGAYEPPSLGATADVMIPRGGLIGQVWDLTCGQPPFATTLADTACAWTYDIRAAGIYRIAVSYAPPAAPGKGSAIHPTLHADTVTIVVSK
jgi:hypothetical protein